MDILDQCRAAIGDRYVLTGADCAKWTTDWTGQYQGDPIAVIRPADTHEVAAIMKIAHATETAVVPVSGNTGLNGGAIARGGLQLSLDRLNQIEAIDTAGRTATVGAGVILSQLHAAADDHDLIFPLTFGARGSAMIGGALSTNAGGSNVLRYGNTRDLVLGIEAVMADGRVMNLMGALHKDNSGLNLKHLLIGAEGTLGVITRAIVKLSPKPCAHATALVAMTDLPAALQLLHHLQAVTSGDVEAFEYMSAAHMAGYARLHPKRQLPFAQPHDVTILIELGCTSPDAGGDGSRPIVTVLTDALAGMLETGHIIDASIAQNESQRAQLWAIREAAAEVAFARKPFVDTDVAVGLSDVPAFLSRMTARLHALDQGADELAVAHLGDGNIHYLVYPTRDDAALDVAIRETVEDVVQDLAGSFSAEHGVGLSKLGSMTRRKDPVALDAMRAIKAALDPKGILNPGKMIPS